MVANLLEAEERRQDGPPPLDARGLVGQIQGAREIVDGALVERGLHLGEAAERRDLRLLRKVFDYAFVGLEAPQDVRPDEVAKGRVSVGVALGHPLGGVAELLGAPEQAGREKVEEGP